MTASNDFVLEATMDDFVCPEGFARITRAGKTDIYAIQHQEYPGDYKVSLAFALDDFEPENVAKTYGEPLILNNHDGIEFLGTAIDNFIPKAPLWETCLEVVQKTPKSAGLLPVIRAMEFLRSKGKQPNSGELDFAVNYYLDDYRNRRAQLIA